MIDDNGPGAVTLGADDRARAVAAVKAVLRVASGDEDDLIAAFAESALGLAEQFTGQLTIARSLGESLAVQGCWQRLGARPVRAISGIEAQGGGALPADLYAIDIDAAGDGWVRVRGGGRVIVRYAAGIAEDWPGLPAPLRQGVALLAAHLFDERDASVAPPAAVTALWRPFRRMTLRGSLRC